MLISARCAKREKGSVPCQAIARMVARPMAKAIGRPIVSRTRKPIIKTLAMATLRQRWTSPWGTRLEGSTIFSTQ